MPFRLHPHRDALFLDIDGTLLDIAPTPEDVFVPRGLTDNLARLHARLGGALALISGRAIEDIDALFTPLRLPAAGAHGAQRRIGKAVEAVQPLPAALRQQIMQAFLPYAGVRIEDKIYSVAVHYRQAPALGKAIEAFLQDMARESGLPLSMLQGKMVCELVDPRNNKGAALEYFMMQPPFAGRRPVFLGDDETDVAAIEACHRLGGVASRIGYDDVSMGEAFLSPQEVRRWISWQ